MTAPSTAAGIVFSHKIPTSPEPRLLRLARSCQLVTGLFFIVLNYLSFLIAHSALPVSILKPSQLTELTSVNSIIQRWLLVSSAEG